MSYVGMYENMHFSGIYQATFSIDFLLLTVKVTLCVIRINILIYKAKIKVKVTSRSKVKVKYAKKLKKYCQTWPILVYRSFNYSGFIPLLGMNVMTNGNSLS